MSHHGSDKKTKQNNGKSMCGLETGFAVTLGALQSPAPPLAAIYYLCNTLIMKHDRSRFLSVGIQCLWVYVHVSEGARSDGLTATCRVASQYVGRVRQPLILCDADLFEQPAGSHQQLRKSWMEAKRRQTLTKTRRKTEIERDWFALVIVNSPELYN